MNKYDDISNYLSTEPNIKNDFDHLTGYITVFLYKNANREKMDDFYNKIPLTFDRIFGISAKTRNTKQVVKSLVDLLNNEKTSFEEFDTLLHLLLPGIEHTSTSDISSNLRGSSSNVTSSAIFRNLFHTVNSPPDLVPNYKIPVSIISRSVNSLISEKKEDFLFSILESFKVLSVPPEYQKAEIENGALMLNIFEYFITLLLISIKEYSFYTSQSSYNTYSKHKINLGKLNKSLAELVLKKSIAIKKPLSDKTKENLFSIDMSKSLIYNFYKILFENLLNYFSGSRYMTDQIKLHFITSAVEMCWLSDFFIIPSSIYMSKNSFETYSYFFKQDSNLYFTPPNIIMLDCLQNLIITLQTGNNLFREQVYNPNYASGVGTLQTNRFYTLDKDGLLFTLQKPLFYFFKTSFLRYSEIYSANSEVLLSDIAKIWFIYITPWMQVDRNHLQVQTQTVSYHKGYTFSSHYKAGSTFDDVVQEFIHMNLLFYTELLNDYIFAFSSLNVLNKNELSLLNKVLDLYKIREGEMIHDYINIRLLEDLAQGKIYVS